MQQATRNIIGIGVGLLAILLVINAALGYRQINELFDQSQLVIHTQKVENALARLLQAVTDAETGQRGYLLTGQKRYLTPYQAATDQYQTWVQEISKLTADNPKQAKPTAKLKELVHAKLTELKETIALYDQPDQGPQVALEEVKTDRGQRAMENIRAVAVEIEQEEEDLLSEREAANRQAFRSATWTVWLSMLVHIAGLAAFVWLLNRHFRAINKSAAALYEQKELLRATLASIGDGVIVTDAGGRVTFLNAVAENLTGWRAGDAIGRPLEAVFYIVNEETRKKVDNPAMRALREGRIMGLANHTVLISKDGTEWPIDDSAAPIADSNRVTCGAVLVFREIKERKHQEQELLAQTAKLEESDRRKTEFLATLAHELRNPLAPINNALQLWPHAENNREQMEQLRATMDRQVRQMIRLIDDLMDVSRISRGKIQLRKQAVSIDTLLQGALESLKPFIESLGHHITLATADVALCVNGDVARLTQVFGNLLHNAAKYTGRSGTIWISALRRGQDAVISIRDNGPGIPRHMLSEIFEMFRQVDATLDRSHGGLGIGLTLVKRIVEAHGGTVEARSEGPGAGTEFIVTLPALPAKANGESVPGRRNRIHQLSNLPRHKILVVDDVEASATTMAMLLRAIGQDVEIRYDGMAALDWLTTGKADVVFLDISMPGMDGYEVARRIRAMPRLNNLVLVALTGYGQDEDRRKAFEAGFNHHLVKPVSIDALEQLLQGLPVAEGGTTV
ncbi:MAG TPA: CHASE3 domain-containing protein [Pirellulales bacterium]|jgi:PAS domain S-box-containing protein|nr:CHASE3 domain-containing protein [Pirellulales bacterium]